MKSDGRKTFRIKSHDWLYIHDPMNLYKVHCESRIWGHVMLQYSFTQQKKTQFATLHIYETFIRQKRLKDKTLGMCKYQQ